MWKTYLLRTVLFIALFAGSVLVFNKIFNRNISKSSVEAEGPYMNLIYMDYNGQRVNAMQGFKDVYDTSLYRSSVLPVGDDKTFMVYIPEELSESPTYQLRSYDSTNLIEEGDLKFVSEEDGYYKYTASIRMDMTAGVEYRLEILTSDDSGKLYYNTRLIRTAASHLADFIEYAEYFSDSAFAGNAVSSGVSLEDIAATGTDAIEALGEETEDTGYLGHVTLKSAKDDIVYTGISIEKLYDDEELRIIEADASGAILELSFTAVSDTSVAYDIREYFTLEYSSSTGEIDLKDYERYMDEQLSQDFISPSSASIELGISSSDEPSFVQSEDSEVVAFVSDNRLWLYDNDNGLYVNVYGMESDLPRGGYDIKLLKIDEGVLYFVVYGRINEGSHEGRNGIALFSYSLSSYSLTEIRFAECSLCFDALSIEAGRFTYYDTNEKLLYTIIGESLVSIDVYDGDVNYIASGISSENIYVSDDGSVIAFPDTSVLSKVTEITVMNMDDGTSFTVSEDGCVLSLMGFVADNLLYGVCDASLTEMSPDGTPSFLFKQLVIVDEDGNVVKTYSKSNILISEVELKDNLVKLTRVNDDAERSEASEDYISYKTPEVSGVLTYGERQGEDGIYRTYIYFPSSVYVSYGASEIVVRLSSDISRDSIVLEDTVGTEASYIYKATGISDKYVSLGKAIQLVSEEGGYIVDVTGKVIYRDKYIASFYTIAGTFEYVKAADDIGSYDACKYMSLAAAGADVAKEDVTTASVTDAAAMLTDWSDAFAEYGVADGINISGVSLNVAIGFVADGVPVTVRVDDRYVMLVSYNSQYVRYYDPVKGEEVRTTRSAFENKLSVAGYEMYTYVVY